MPFLLSTSVQLTVSEASLCSWRPRRQSQAKGALFGDTKADWQRWCRSHLSQRQSRLRVWHPPPETAELPFAAIFVKNAI